MATVNEKIKSIKRVIELSESTLSCEKARIPMVKAEALRLFQVEQLLTVISVFLIQKYSGHP